jgi:HK97 family phage portal protein
MSLDSALNSLFTTRSADLQGGSIFDIPLFGGGLSAVNNKSAMTLSAFYNGVDQLSNDIAKLPKGVFRKENDSRFAVSEHPVNYLMAVAPNEMMTAFDFWKIVVVSVILKGNAYARIVRNKTTGAQTAWIFLDKSDVEVIRMQDKLYYRHKGEVIDSADILHIKGMSYDGIIGIPIVTFAARQLGVSLEAQEYGATVYKDRGLGYGVIEADGDVNPVNKKAIEEGFVSKMSQKSPFKVPMLDNGMKYKSITISPAEAQFLETNKNGVIEVARWLNINPYKLKELGNSNFSNMQQMSIEHVQDSLLPWIVRIEQEVTRKVFTDQEKMTLYVKLNEKFLLRGDLAARSQYYKDMIFASVMPPNEVRALEDLNPIEGLGEPLIAVNMQPLSVAKNAAQQNLNSTKK